MTQTARHYGFSQVPRILIRGEQYKDVSLIELGLYTGLKDICGDDGECFYTLRNLADLLHTSISTLSRYIPKLRDTWKLITAEKKTRGSGTNKHEIWHIRMVNIWQENDVLYTPKECFTEKQSLESVSDGNKLSDQTPKSVSQRNSDSFISDSVSQRNNFVADRNEDCFYLTDRRRTTMKDNHKGDKEEEAIAFADHQTPSLLDDFVFQIAIEDWMTHKSEVPPTQEADEVLTPCAKELIASLREHEILTQETLPAYSQSNPPQQELHSDSTPVVVGCDASLMPSEGDIPTSADMIAGEKEDVSATGVGGKRIGTPQMPPAEMKWGPEKMVQVTEAMRFANNKQGIYFSEEVRGKKGKSQRQRQLDAAIKIIALDITEEQYTRAYIEQNTEWWNSTQGSLTVEKMYAGTPRNVIRIVEILERLESKSTGVGSDRLKKQSGTTAGEPARPSVLISPENVQRNIERAKARIAAKQATASQPVQSQIAL